MKATELLPFVAQYGLLGVLIVGVLALVWKAIDQGIDLRIPPKRRLR